MRRTDTRLRTARPTMLAFWMADNEVSVEALAKRSGYSRAYISLLRVEGRVEPRRISMVNITKAAGDLVKRRVTVGELFDLSP